MQNLHVFIIKYLPATNTLPSRVKITSERFKQSIILDYDYSFNSCLDIAEDYLNNLGHEIIGCGEGKNNDYIIAKAVDNSFKQLK